MKRLTVFIIAMIMVATSGYGKDFTLPHLIIHSGITKPASPNEFSKSWTTGANVGIGLGYDISKRVELFGTVNYNHLTLNSRGIENLYKTSSLAAIEGGPASITCAQLMFKLNFPSDKTPNILSSLYTGIGYNSLFQKKISIYETDEDKIIDSNTKNMPSIEFGIGFEYLLEDTAMFLQIGVNIGFHDPDNFVYLPVKFGVVIN